MTSAQISHTTTAILATVIGAALVHLGQSANQAAADVSTLRAATESELRAVRRDLARIDAKLDQLLAPAR